jgi:hypothetical protein
VNPEKHHSPDIVSLSVKRGSAADHTTYNTHVPSPTTCNMPRPRHNQQTNADATRPSAGALPVPKPACEFHKPIELDDLKPSDIIDVRAMSFRSLISYKPSSVTSAGLQVELSAGALVGTASFSTPPSTDGTCLPRAPWGCNGTGPSAPPVCLRACARV